MITIASWNINSINVRIGHVLTWLETHKPDILMLQELKTVSEKFPFEKIREAGYHATVKGQPSYNGVSILSREPVELRHDILPGMENDPQARFQHIHWRDLEIINIYAPNGNPVGTEKFTYKLDWLSKLRDHLQKLRQTRKDFLIGGDFNIIPEDIDAKHPYEWVNDALFQPESRQMWRGLCHLGLTDAFRAHHPKEKEYTFWDYQAGSWPRNNGIRIDHFLLSPNVADRLQQCFIDKEPRGAEKPSDHTPIVIQLAD